MKKQLYSGIIVILLAFSVMLPGTKVEAACSQNGFINSGGACINSFSSTIANTSGSQVTAIQSYIAQLFLLLEQLRDLQAQLHGIGNNNQDNSDIEVTTKSASNIDDDSAKLNGEIDFNDEDEATVYFEFGKQSSNLKYDTTHFVLDDDDGDTFTHTITSLDEDTKYYFRAVAEDEDGDKDRGAIRNFTTDEEGSNSSNGDTTPEVETEDADDITGDSAVLNGEVDMNDFDNGIVFFVYGEDEDQVDDIASDYDEYSDVEEDGDDLQTQRVDRELDNYSEFSYEVSGLTVNTDIYFALCVEYVDEDDDNLITCGSTENFETNNSDDDDDTEPDVVTEDPIDVQEDSARIKASIDMNDFDNGIVFFVYGEDEDQVDDIASDYDEYSDVEEDGDDLQKLKVDNDLDEDNATYTAFFNGLNSDTTIYYTACVEYKNNNNDQVLTCGDTEEFQTDN